MYVFCLSVGCNSGIVPGHIQLFCLFSSPEPFADGELLRSRNVHSASSVVNSCFKGNLFYKLLPGFLPNMAGMVLIWHSLIIVQMVLVRCIPRSHRLKIDFQDENFKNFLV